MMHATWADRPSRHRRVRLFSLIAALSLASLPVLAQDRPRVFAGSLFGVSALSADAQSVSDGPELMLSLYDPKNGPAVNLFAGWHIAEYFSLQANWVWNRNDLTLTSSRLTPQGGSFYEQRRQSHQHAAVLDGLIYFRRRDSTIRPYLGTGIAVVHFSSRAIDVSAHGLPPPAGDIASTSIGLRSHVGIDLRLSRRVDFRYSFSETISGNPISESLTPPGRRRLMNFQNLFGLVARF
jgi:hypothetical protein